MATMVLRAVPNRLLRELVCRSLFIAVTLIACSADPSPADQQRLQLLQERFAGRYAFALEGEFYLRAEARDSVMPSRADMEEAYRAFMSDESGRRRNTTFVYLNVYDSQGDFIYQLTFDPHRGSFVEGQREHY